MLVSVRNAGSSMQESSFVELQPTMPGIAQNGHSRITGRVTAGSFAGNGLNLTSLSASNLTAGIVNDARLSANVVLGNGNTTFTGINRFTKNVIFTSQVSSLIFPAVASGNVNAMISMFASGTANAERMILAHSPNYPNWGLSYDDGTDRFHFKRAGTPYLTLDSENSRVGLGTSSPQAKLHVLSGSVYFEQNDAGGIPSIDFALGDHDTGFDSPADGVLDLYLNGTHFARAASTSLNIGTNTPLSDVKLQVVGQQNPSQNGIINVLNGPERGSYAAGRYGLRADASGDDTNVGVFAVGLSAQAGRGFGVAGIASGAGQNTGVYGQASGGTLNYAGYFEGLLHATSASSTVKAFVIDHPLDPENMLLSHSSVESNERLNLYRGTTTTNAQGYSRVTVPEWFGALNRNIQYQITIVDDGSDQDEWVFARIASKLKNGSFVIRTSQPNTEVHWQVSGERHDPASKRYPLIVEQQKPNSLRGRYLVPEAYGLGRERAMVPPPGVVPVQKNAPN